MPSADDSTQVMKLVHGFHQLAEHRVRNTTLPLSTIVAVAEACLQTRRYFPPGLTPKELGDGALIERLGRHSFKVYERFEIGQLRYSSLSSRRYVLLRSAVLRYLRHYAVLLRIDRVHIRKWA